MSEAFMYTFLAVLGVSLISAFAAIFYPQRVLKLKTPILVFVGIAIGALLGDAFIHLIPEATESLGETTGLWVLGGIGVFFLLEKVLHWHHHHETHEGEESKCGDCTEHIEPFGYLVVISDVLHNVVDGVIIAAGFLVSTEVGVATTIAVALHELPQEIGDFGVLLHAGFSRMRALIANVSSAMSAFIGAAIVFILGNVHADIIPIFSALAAGSFIYIAAADLVPELHKHARTQDVLVQLGAVVFGVSLMFALTFVEAHTNEHEYDPTAPQITQELSPPFAEKHPQETDQSPFIRASLVRVVDGDTIRVVDDVAGNEFAVRMIGIDAPETNAGNVKTPECYARESTKTLEKLLPLSEVRLVTDPTQDTYDVYGRLLAYVFLGNQNINQEMIESGAAKEYTYKGRIYEYQKEFKRAQEAARLSARGLWEVCYE